MAARISDPTQYGVQFRYFDLDGLPVRMESPDRLPQVWDTRGKWEFLPLERLPEAEPISRRAFNAMAAKLGAPPSGHIRPQRARLHDRGKQLGQLFSQDTFSHRSIAPLSTVK
jgi:hypothetical protein